MDKISYALGLGIGQQLKSMNIENFNVQDFTQSICDVLTDAEPAISHREAQALLNEYFDRQARQQAQGAIAAGKAFLEENGKKEGVVTTKSGLQYTVLSEGTGRSPKATDRVRCHYEGTLIDGTVFDSSYKRKQPATFACNQVIKGWTEALTMMPVGSKWEIYIPQDLGYGAREAGKIPPFSTLIFTVELLEIVQ